MSDIRSILFFSSDIHVSVCFVIEHVDFEIMFFYFQKKDSTASMSKEPGDRRVKVMQPGQQQAKTTGPGKSARKKPEVVSSTSLLCVIIYCT